MKKDLTEIMVILDRSGSMDYIKQDAIGGFNAFVEAQKNVPGKANISLIQFDDKYEENYISKPLKKVQKLNNKTYVPRGMTALLDAIGRAVVGLGAKLAAQPESERPSKVIVAIITDGQENASKEYNSQHIKDMIKEQEDKYSWEFVYLSSDLSAMSDAVSYGIKGANVIQFDNNSASVNSTYKTLGRTVSTYRTTGIVDIKAAKKKDKDDLPKV
jgi:hypothetical protein